MIKNVRASGIDAVLVVDNLLDSEMSLPSGFHPNNRFHRIRTSQNLAPVEEEERVGQRRAPLRPGVSRLKGTARLRLTNLVTALYEEQANQRGRRNNF